MRNHRRYKLLCYNSFQNTCDMGLKRIRCIRNCLLYGIYDDGETFCVEIRAAVGGYGAQLYFGDHVKHAT